jgi:hypothetical protein
MSSEILRQARRQSRLEQLIRQNLAAHMVVSVPDRHPDNVSADYNAVANATPSQRPIILEQQRQVALDRRAARQNTIDEFMPEARRLAEIQLDAEEEAARQRPGGKYRRSRKSKQSKKRRKSKRTKR